MGGRRAGRIRRAEDRADRCSAASALRTRQARRTSRMVGSRAAATLARGGTTPALVAHERLGGGDGAARVPSARGLAAALLQPEYGAPDAAAETDDDDDEDDARYHAPGIGPVGEPIAEQHDHRGAHHAAPQGAHAAKD